MTQIQLVLPDYLHYFFEKIVSPMAPERVLSEKSKSINVWLPDSVNDIITANAKKYGFSKSGLCHALLLAYSQNWEDTPFEREILSRICKEVIAETRKYETRYKIGLTKAIVIPAILKRIIVSTDITQFCSQLNKIYG